MIAARLGQRGEMRVSHKLVRFARKSPRQFIRDLIKFARKSRHERAFIARRYLGNWDWRIPRYGNDRTAYVIGLFGSGRGYITTLLLKHLGKRAKYFRETIRFHPGPTSMIYSGHATIKHVCRDQHSPEVMSHILEAVQSRFADLIFIYRHPLDSLLTNWIWWRTYLRDNTQIEGLSQIYKSSDEFASDLDRNFLEFKSFAEGDSQFFASLPGPRFLSFVEFVEETELYLNSATLALRLEDFMVDPLKEFSKIVEVMSAHVDPSRLRLEPPRSKPYGYLALKEKVPRFREFLNKLDGETKRRIEKSGYSV
jgi:hypothetical protein